MSKELKDNKTVAEGSEPETKESPGKIVDTNVDTAAVEKKAAIAEPGDAEVKQDADKGKPESRAGADKPESSPADAEPATDEQKEAEKAEPAAETPPAQTEMVVGEPLLQDSKIEIRDGEKFIKLEDLPPESEYSPEQIAEMEEMYKDTLSEIREGEIVTGRVIAISDKEVAVDIGFKSEGAVSTEEFDDIGELKVGDQIDVFLESVEDSDGQLILSKKKADFMRIWEKVRNVYEEDGIIRGRCTRRIKGGMVVDLGGVDAFLPGSQIDIRPVRDFESIIGQEMDFRILKINDLRKNVVISHKILVEESLHEVREKLLENLKVGDILEGTVKNITDFGVFVDLGGVDGLLHITDLSWGRVTHPTEVVQLDQRIKVKVLNYDPERKRISLGLKQLYSHLWDEIDRKFSVGQKVQGRIVSLAKYGAFVEIEPGIEGLVHISEMSWTQHVRHPSQIVHEGDYVQIVILNIDKDNRKISLGLKQVEEDPWETFEAKYRVDTRHKGIVRDLVPFGAFVELEDNIDGLIHISDLSWTKKVRHPGETLKKGQEIEVVILDFDRDERRIALGYKQLEENPWEQFARDVPVGGRTTGTVVRVIDKGVLVELPYKIEGFVPNSQISRKFFDGKKRNVQVGDVMKLQLLEFDKDDRKAVLSNSQAQTREDAAVARTYAGASSGGSSATLADTLGEDNPLLQAYKAAKAEEKASGKKKTAKKTASKKKEAPSSAGDEDAQPGKVEEQEPDTDAAQTKKEPEAAETPEAPEVEAKAEEAPAAAADVPPGASLEAPKETSTDEPKKAEEETPKETAEEAPRAAEATKKKSKGKTAEAAKEKSKADSTEGEEAVPKKKKAK